VPHLDPASSFFTHATISIEPGYQNALLRQNQIRQVKYLNNVVEQDHRAIKRIIRPMLGFKDFHCARVILSGIEIMHMIAKAQIIHTGKIKPSAACQFYSLVM
jgi:putative transposase